MKKLLFLFTVLLFISCSGDDNDSSSNSDDTNAVYLDENGVTVKARDWAVVGDSAVINGISYTIVDGATLRTMIKNGDDVTRVCTKNNRYVFSYR